MKSLSLAPLGKSIKYATHYNPNLLFPILRQEKRQEIGIQEALPFQGQDLWNAYELSWLDSKGKPQVRRAEFVIPCDSPFLIESKSLKLYLNSFTQTTFKNDAVVIDTLTRDFSAVTQSEVQVKIFPLFAKEKLQRNFSGLCIDKLNIQCESYSLQPNYLSTHQEFLTETLYSNLLKSNCLITGQPDWGSIQIKYTGKKINHEGLLRYIVSFRNHEEFHEQCVERIFMDVMRYCQPKKLLVYARYTRRGGLDINPFRANYSTEVKNTRLARQ